MSRKVRFRELPQASLPLGHGQVHWDMLPSRVRERVLTLWIQLLTEHWSRRVERLPATATPRALPPSSAEGRR